MEEFILKVIGTIIGFAILDWLGIIAFCATGGCK